MLLCMQTHSVLSHRDTHTLYTMLPLVHGINIIIIFYMYIVTVSIKKRLAVWTGWKAKKRNKCEWPY